MQECYWLYAQKIIISDVEKFFKKKENYLVNFSDFIIKKIDWNLKSKNILEISKELNLGTSSFIFLDDSDHEINEVKTAIKDIDCILVPKNLEDYKKTLLNISKYFSYSAFETGEDSNRTKLYQDEEKRTQLKSNYSYEEYLKNLSLEMKFSKGKDFDLKRLVQMTQKTNQFNLTVLRQSEIELKKKLLSKKYLTYAFSLRDKFGDYGTVGLCQIKILDKDSVIIENILMSCRVMGRNAEQTFISQIISTLKKKKYVKIFGLYSKGQKNQIVKNFYLDNGFIKVSKKKQFGYNGDLYIYKENKVVNKIKVIRINNG
jgi:FkbH-like protein